MDFDSLLILVFIALFSFFLIYYEGLLTRKRSLVIAIAFIAAAFVIRGMCMDFVTLDYENFLTKWVSHFRDNGGFKALSEPVGNYNLPYLYFLAIISYSGIWDLYLIKLFSIFFDIVLAWSLMKLVGVFTQSTGRRLFAFLAVLLLPTVILNGSLWGQCDSIYAAFAVMSLWLALSGRPVLSVAAIGISFAFKLQAIFIMPIFFVFLYTKRIKPWHLAVFPAVYFLLALPAIFSGRPVIDTIMLYADQTGSIGSGLNYNSPSIFSFVSGNPDTELLSKFGIAAAFIFCFAVFLWLYIIRKRVSDYLLLCAALLFAIGIPFLLPHMHDRYFFLADILTVGLAIIAPVCFPLPFLASFASLLGYHAYLRQRYLLPMKYGAAALIVVMSIILFCMIYTLSAPGNKKPRKYS